MTDSTKPMSSHLQQAIGIMAVDNISPSDFALDLMRKVEVGIITHEQARQILIDRARAKVSSNADAVNHPPTTPEA